MAVTISSVVFWSDWPYSADATFEIRAKSNRSWISAESEIVGAGESRVLGTGTITALRPTLPSIVLPATSAGLDDQTAKWTVTLHRVGKSQPVTIVLADFSLPVSFEPSTTWAAIKIHKNGKQPLRDTSVYTKAETDYQISLAVGSQNRANVGVLGNIETATIPADALHPKAVLTEDPRVLDISNYASFAAMIAAVGATPTTFNIHGNINVTANATVPANISLRFLQGGKLTLTTGVTLIIQGPIIADPIRIFYNALASQGTISFSGNKSIYGYRPEWWGAVTDGITNAQSQLQAMINAVSTAGGGRMLFGGTYYIDGAFDPTENSLLTIPRVSLGQAQKTFIFEGVSNSFTTSDSRPVHGAIWKIGPVTGLGTAPSVISARAFLVTSSSSNFSYITPIFKNLYIMTEPNPTFSVINMYNAANLQMEYVQIDTGTTLGTQVEPTTATSYAVLTPGVNNYAQLSMRHVSILGAFYNGIYANEHLRFDKVFVTRCKRAIVVGDTNLPISGQIFVSHCPTVIRAEAINGYFDNLSLGIERWTTTGEWYAPGAGGAVEFDKVGTNVAGRINYTMNLPGSGPSTLPMTHNLPVGVMTLDLVRVNAGHHHDRGPWVLGGDNLTIYYQTEDADGDPADMNTVQHIESSGGLDYHLSANANFGGGMWARTDEAIGSANMYLSPFAREIRFRQTALGAGAITWVDMLVLSPSGVTAAVLAATTSLAIGSGTAITKMVKGTVTINPSSINANTVASQTFALAGAVVGDALRLNPPAAGLTAGLLVCQAFVSAADTITIVFFNQSGAPIDEASASWTYALIRS